MSLADIILQSARNDDDQSEDTDIITFIESTWGLNTRLYSVQRVILKAHYGIGLDTNPHGFDLSKPIPEDHPLFESEAYIPRGLDGEPAKDDPEYGYYKYVVEITDWKRENKRGFSEAEYLAHLYDEGRCNIREVVQGEERRELVLSIGRRSGKCVLGDTLVLTDNGLCRIEDLGLKSGAEKQPLEVLVAQEGSAKSKSAFFYNPGVKNVRKFTTSYGFTLGGTDEHRVKVLCPEGFIRWGYLADLRVGDVVCVHRGTRLFSSSLIDLHQPDDTFPQFLGPDWAENFAKAVLWFEPNHGSFSLREGCPFDLDSFGSSKRKLKKFFTSNGLSLTPDRGIPWCVLRSPFEESIRPFLREVFQYATHTSNNVTLETPYPRLMHELQVLLANVGVIAKVVSGTLSLIGSYNVESLQRVLSGNLNHPPDSDHVIPYLGNLVGDSLDMFSQDHPLRCGLEVTHSFLRGIQAAPFSKTSSASSQLKHILDSHYFYDPVVSITETRKRVYDLTVPDGESFVANGFTNHNTFMCACIMAYEVYKLIRKEEPQKYYGLPISNVINLICVATGIKQAALLYNEASGHFSNCSFFQPYTANNTQSYAKFQTPGDVDRYGAYKKDNSAPATLNCSFLSCVAKGLRGLGCILVILDELAHFNTVGQSDALTVYRAIQPSLAAYSPKNPNNTRQAIGPVESRLCSISSPLGKQGFFYQKFMQGFKGDEAARNLLCIQAPTWEVNPTVEASFLAASHATDAESFFTEYGAYFSDRTLGWLAHSDIANCIDPTYREPVKAPTGRPHFAGLDISSGLVDGDYCALSIGHLEDGGKIVVDVMVRIRAGEGEYAHLERLDFDIISEWVLSYHKKFFIVEGVFDQWAGYPFEEAMHKVGLTQFHTEFFTKPQTSTIFRTAKSYLLEKKVVFFDREPVKSEDVFGDYLQEMFELQAHTHSKYVITVEAPNLPGKYDDYSDAFVRMIWKCSLNAGKRKFTASSSRGGPNPSMSLAQAQRNAQMRSRLRRGGSHPGRRLPNPKRRR